MHHNILFFLRLILVVEDFFVKFVIYHEFLHRDNHSHDKAFKEKEHLYPNFEDHEAFLFGRMNEFDIKDF